MRVYSIKYVMEFLGISRKMIKRILFDLELISNSWAVIDAQGMVVELIKDKDGVKVTKLLITEAGIILLDQEVHNV